MTIKMNPPVPAPRSLQSIDNKKPIPTPRTTIPVRQQDVEDEQKNTGSPNKPNEMHQNTFTRRVRTLSSTSKQITEELAGKVQEKKKAVIEGTRQSVRKIARRFTTASADHASIKKEKKEDEVMSEPDVDIFNSISFQSPIKSNDLNIYNNISEFECFSSSSSNDSTGLPPPLHPPPPLREESVYDQPQSVASGSTNSSGSYSVTQNAYESVFPSYPYNSDTDSCVDMTAGTINRKVDLSRSESWTFYDPVTKTENIYSNVDNTPILMALSVEDAASELSLAMSHLEVRNSLYENHEIQLKQKKNQVTNRPTESILLQFDPLRLDDSSSTSHNLKMLEEILQGDLYGNISNVGTYEDNWSSSNDESEAVDYMNPPTPPTRFDSLPEEAPVTPTVKEDKFKSNWFTTELPKTSTEPKKSNWFKQVNEVLKKAPDVIKGFKQNKENMLQRPSIFPRGVVQQKGMLYKVTNGPVEDLFGEFSGRWCVLENGKFICYSDHHCDGIKEQFPMENILSVQILLDQKYKYKYENEDLHCLEINVSGKSRGGHVYGSRSVSERRIWLQRIAESLSSRFSSRVTSDYNRIGWAYVCEGVSGEWIGAWIILSQRMFYYAIDNYAVKQMDMRKARCIGLQTLTDNDKAPRTADSGPNLLIDCTSGALYLRMWTSRETKAWSHIIKLAAHSNGAMLEQQQLTKQDVPVIVEKCINFIYAHGSMSEGIYRRAGGGSAVQDLLAQFRRDAWAVQLTSDKYTEHDVATTLKRFFRDLPEPLLMTSNRQYLCEVSQVTNLDEKIRMYRAVFDNFSAVSGTTVRKLMGHLHFISTQKKYNLMNVDNLAAIWGPTLMYCEEKGDAQYGHKETQVVVQLISLYRNIFPERPDEADKERIMLEILEKCTKSPQGAVNTKASGDFRVWVHLYNKEGQTFNVAIGPQKTAYDVCVELSSKIKLPVNELQLEELVLNDSLTRPIHHTEKVLDVALRWGYWNEQDRKDNCLILSPLSKYWEYIQEKPHPVSGELRYADNKSKIFRTFSFEFTQAKLCYYKDRTFAVKLGEWNIEDILWYLGNEPKRNPMSKWTITFILRKQPPVRTKSAPWFGHIISWNDPAFRATWLAAMLKAEHPKNLTPPPQHVNLMLS